ncbi:MAG: Bor family protein [Anditalea sp.]
MKKSILNLAFVLGLSLMMTSCFTYSFSVGEGAQTGMEERKMNHYLIYGLAPLSVTDPNELAGGAENYDVTIVHTFVDGLINAITFGIYSPTTTIIKK